jgi:branched-chain amino acid transport system permease protein
VLTGWAAQLSLMHGALLGVGAFAMAWYANRFDIPLGVAIVLAGLTAAGVAGLVSLASYRLRGAQLVILTVAVAQAGSDWLFEQVNGIDRTVYRPAVAVG